MKQLSMASSQLLLSLVKEDINAIQADIEYMQLWAKEFYENSDKNDKKTTPTFKLLNETRNNIRFNKRKIKKLAKTAKELKVSVKSDSLSKLEQSQ